jgi:type I restriction enzyme, S subunit
MVGKLNVAYNHPFVRQKLTTLESGPFPLSKLIALLSSTNGIRYGVSTPPPILVPSETTVPFIRATDIKNGEILTENLLQIDVNQNERMQKCLLEVGEMILVRSGVNTGDCAIVSNSLAGSYAAYDLILNFTDEVIPLFISTFLDTKVGRIQLNVLKDRAAQSHLNAEEVSSILIPKPPIEIQRSLVAEIEAARQTRKQKLAQADELFASTDTYLLEQLGIKLSIKPNFVNAQCFGVKLRNVGIRLDPFYSLPEHQVLETALSDCPSNVLAIGDKRVVREIVEGRITPKPEFYSEDPEDPIFLRAQNIEKGYLNLSDAKRLKRDAFENEPKAILLDGDIVLTIDGALLGIAAVHRSGDEDCCISNHMVRIQHGVETDPEYLTWFLNSTAGQRQIKRGITGSAIPGIRTDAIERIFVPIPPLEVQRSLVLEIEKRRADAQRLRQEAEAEWEAAKTRFERKLLGEEV